MQASRACPERTLEVRYEDLVRAPVDVARDVSSFLQSDAEPLGRAFQAAHGRSVGRWRHELDEAQLADVEREAGALLRELGYS